MSNVQGTFNQGIGKAGQDAAATKASKARHDAYQKELKAAKDKSNAEKEKLDRVNKKVAEDRQKQLKDLQKQIKDLDGKINTRTQDIGKERGQKTPDRAKIQKLENERTDLVADRNLVANKFNALNDTKTRKPRPTPEQQIATDNYNRSAEAYNRLAKNPPKP